MSKLFELLRINIQRGMDIPARRFLGIVIAINTVTIIGALAIGDKPDDYFGEEDFITYLSFLWLLISSGLAYHIHKTRKADLPSTFWKAPSFLWLIIAISFLYLSLDEIGEIHEHMDSFIHNILRIPETGLTDRIDDLLVGCYGLIGLEVIYLYREELRNYRGAFPLLAAGFALMFFMVFLDVVTNRDDVLNLLLSDHRLAERVSSWLGAIEEMLKVYAEAMFMGTFHSCLKISGRLSFSPLAN